MSDIAIRIEDLGKKYWIGAGRSRNDRFGEWLVHTLKTPARRIKGLLRGYAAAAADLDQVFWALRHVGFEVTHGEVLGIIGRNGAGKSTLLKILSRITDPTEGRVEIRGRVGSLLEVGTGFHPDLTGRENVYLNGAVLGMRKAEVAAKFDEIIDFSEVEQFIDTPVKHYSSGMYTRLAFSVAAHLEPEILIVDEVLAVGDASFQRKCMEKMHSVAASGRTVLYVGHNMRSVMNLCDRAVWLEKGTVRDVGSAEDVTIRYLKAQPELESQQAIADLIRELPPDPSVRMVSIAVIQDGIPTTKLRNGTSTQVRVIYDVLRREIGLRAAMILATPDRDSICRSWVDEMVDRPTVTEPGRYCVTAEIPADTLLAPKEYVIQIWMGISGVRSCFPHGLPIGVRTTMTSRVNIAYPNVGEIGHVRVPIRWTVEQTQPLEPAEAEQSR